MLTLLILAFGKFLVISNHRESAARLYKALLWIVSRMSIIMLFSFGISIYQIYVMFLKAKSFYGFWENMGEHATLRNVFISLLASYGVFIIAAIIHLDFLHIITAVFQYIILIPTAINIFMLYAFSNLHDTSWGTKGANNCMDQVNKMKSAVLEESELENSQFQINPDKIDHRYRLNSWELSRPEAEEKVDCDNRTQTEDYFR